MVWPGSLVVEDEIWPTAVEEMESVIGLAAAVNQVWQAKEVRQKK